MKRISLSVLPLLIFLSLALFLWKGLSLKPQEIPSAQVGHKVPELSLPLLNKPQQNFTNNLFNDQVTLLNVWSSWCMSCKDEQSFLLKLAQQGIKIYGLNYKDETNRALSWLKVWGNPYQIIAEDQNGRAALDLGVYGSPETFIIDKNAVIRYRHAGILNQQVWEDKFLPIIRNLEKA